MTVELTEFLLARIAEDEAQAREDYANGMTGHLWKHYPVDAYERIQWLTLARGKRMAAECEAKRRIVERHHPDRHLENWYWLERKCAECGHGWHKWVPNRLPTDIGPEQGCPTLRDLASVYADHSDYRQEWRP